MEKMEDFIKKYIDNPFMQKLSAEPEQALDDLCLELRQKIAKALEKKEDCEKEKQKLKRFETGGEDRNRICFRVYYTEAVITHMAEKVEVKIEDKRPSKYYAEKAAFYGTLLGEDITRIEEILKV